jgi:hypothetical protein
MGLNNRSSKKKQWKRFHHFSKSVKQSQALFCHEPHDFRAIFPLPMVSSEVTPERSRIKFKFENKEINHEQKINKSSTTQSAEVMYFIVASHLRLCPCRNYSRKQRGNRGHYEKTIGHKHVHR